MRTYKRINEDYLDSIDCEYTEDLSMNIDINIDMLLNGQVPNINFNIIKEPIYKIPKRKVLRVFINSCMKIYGNDCCLNWIDVSDYDDMRRLFYNCAFNGDISKWDVSNVINMNSMFENSYFNGDISKWDVSNVHYMDFMFFGSNFNGDISRWNVSSVENFKGIFNKCPLETQPEKQPKFKI